MIVSPAELIAQRRLIDAIYYSEGNIIELGPRLEAALEAARNARELIAPAQEDLRATPLIDNSSVERAAREWQLELIARQLTHCAEIAEERLRFFDKVITEADVADVHAKCQDGVAGTLFWFKYFAWGYDPRPLHPLSLQPFAPFPFQDAYIQWLERTIFVMRRSGTVEKAREMGASYVAYGWSLKQWRYRPNSSFLWMSQNEDLVDNKKDSNTIFERLRQILGLQPTWWLPKGFSEREHTPYMLIANPENGSTITGKAPTKAAGRQSRVTAVFKDESAFWPYGGYPQHTSLSQTSPCLIDISSVAGQFNQFADLARSEHANNFVMDWREHPWKDQRWYDSLPFGYVAPIMSPEAIAQEIDRNYAASQPGKVFRFYSEPHMFITWEELVEHYEVHGLADQFFDALGQYVVPTSWSWARTFDYGQTEGHPWIVCHVARPPEVWPLNDTLFVFSAHKVTPTAATEAQAQAQFVEIEQRLGFRKYDGTFDRPPKYSNCSHEADSVRETFRDEHGERWLPWNTDYNDGISQLQAWFTVIQRNEPNPFRAVLEGRTRIVFVAPDGQYSLLTNQSRHYYLSPSKGEAGYKLLRRELESYHYPEEEKGKAVKDMRPFKLLDDAIDNLRAHAIHWGPKGTPATEAQRKEKNLPPELQAKAIADVRDEQERHNKLLSRTTLLARMRSAKSKTKHWNAED